MAHQGDTIINPVNGERITFVRTVEDADTRQEAALEVDYFIPAGAPGVPGHVHLVSEETFEVVSGTLGIWVGSPRHERTLGPGERVTFVPRVAHRHWNAGKDDLSFKQIWRPAGNVELGLQATFGLAQDGKANKAGLPRSILNTMLILQLLGSVPAGLPLPLALVIVRSGAALARLFGQQQQFPQYTKLAAPLVLVP